MPNDKDNNKLQSFIDQFGGGLRPNRFIVNGTFPAVVGTVDDQFTFLIRAANLPSSDLSLISVPYRGRDFKIPGNRTYLPWQIVVLDDKGSGTTSIKSLWRRFHEWSNLINSHISNITSDTDDNSKNFVADYMKNFTVTQLDINGNCEKTINLIQCWPSEIGQIDLDMSDNENFTTFTVTLEYQYFSRVNCPT